MPESWMTFLVVSTAAEYSFDDFAKTSVVREFNRSLNFIRKQILLGPLEAPG